MEEKYKILARYFEDTIGEQATEKLAKSLTLAQVRQLASVLDSEIEVAVVSELEYILQPETRNARLARLFDRLAMYRKRIESRENHNAMAASNGNAGEPVNVPDLAITATG